MARKLRFIKCKNNSNGNMAVNFIKTVYLKLGKTLTMEYDSVDKTYIDRLKAFCIPLKLEYL